MMQTTTITPQLKADIILLCKIMNGDDILPECETCWRSNCEGCWQEMARGILERMK